MLDYTCIEIFDSDNIKKFFRIDDNIFINKIRLIDKEIFILQYPLGELSFALGKIVDIQDDMICHNVNTESGSSGSPLIKRYNNNLIIGIHYGAEKDEITDKYIYNLAIPFDIIIKDIKEQLLDYKKDTINSENSSVCRNIINLTGRIESIPNSKRILRGELEELQKNPLLAIGCLVGLIEKDNYYRWRATITGADDTDYRGGCFFIEFYFPDDYPKKGPKIKFLTPIYHLNVSNKGEVYPNFINNWNPSTKVKEILIKLFTIFYLNALGAVFDCKQRDEFINKPTLFYTKLRYFTKKYAILGNELDYNNNKSWDFSYNELNLKQTNPE